MLDDSLVVDFHLGELGSDGESDGCCQVRVVDAHIAHQRHWLQGLEDEVVLGGPACQEGGIGCVAVRVEDHIYAVVQPRHQEELIYLILVV